MQFTSIYLSRFLGNKVYVNNDAGGNTATEFAGVAGSMDIFGISKYITVPLVAIAIWLLVVKGTYKSSV